MSELIEKWVLNRLGVIIDITPDNFAVKTSTGLLLAQILKSYEIISAEELSLIKESDAMKDCYNNFRLLNVWLKNINLTVNNEDIYEIIHGIGSTSLYLFYEVFLELKDKSKLDFLTEKELNIQLGRHKHQFHVSPIIEQEETNQFDLHSEKLCEPFLAGGDVFQWYKDRVENLYHRVNDARDEYIHILKMKRASLNEEVTYGRESDFILSSLYESPKTTSANQKQANLPDEDLSSLDIRTYDELVNEQKKARQLPPVTPDPKKAKDIIKNLHVKSKIRLENKILRNQLHEEIMCKFDKKIHDTKSSAQDQYLINIFIKQSLYEKELVTKVGQVKMQKEYMIENKFKQAEILNKLKDKKFMEALVLKDKELNEAKLIFHLERERVLQLHRKIWEERLKLRDKRHEELCSQALNDMLDISVKISQYKKRFGREPGKREMEEIKNLFVSGQSVFGITSPAIDILKEDTDEDIPEEIITKEMDRQNSIDEEEFEKYMHYEWPWELKNIDTSPEVFEQISYGLNVLGCIVHRALDSKYPISPLRDRPNLPETDIRVCINGINDISILPRLRHLLSERNIKIMEISQAAEYCMEAYRQESKREYDEEEELQATPAEGKPKTEKPPKPKKGEKPSKKKKEKLGELSDEVIKHSMKLTENKLVQTPIKYPCEEIPYSPPALLGKATQELLDAGASMGDFLLVDMFVEYLKSIPDLKGWVLVNYPTTYEQAIVLEEALTGIFLQIVHPDKSRSLSEITDTDQLDEKEDWCVDEDLEHKRISHLLPNPVLTEPVQRYQTDLTAYIRIKKLPHDDKSADAVLPPIYEELGNEPDPLDKFYSDAGANYTMYYKEFDFPTLKYLGKLIIGDYSLPLKPSVELFGENAILDDEQSKLVKATKKGEPAKKKKERFHDDDDTAITKTVPDKKDKAGKKKIAIVYENKAVQAPTDDEEEIEEISIHEEVEVEVPSAGQPGWEYSEVVCPEELLHVLATLWETVEEIYINDLKQLFFLNRLNMNSVMPFVQHVNDIMKRIIERPDYKGFYLARFQKAFNKFEMDFRKDDEFKAEMHCRVEDFKEKLIEMSDIKMMESENMRCHIINADWTPCQMTELINNYINMIQIELDRCVDSIHLIDDYYLGVMLGMPSDQDSNKDDPIPKYSNINSGVINSMFEDCNSIIDMSYFEELLSLVIQKAQYSLKKINAIVLSNIDKTKASRHSNEKAKSKPNSARTMNSKDLKKSVEQDSSILRENYNKLVEEWQCAVKGEMLRVNLRIDLLKYNALQMIEEFLKNVQQSFHDIYNQIRTKYWNEVENIQKLCDVFRSAVENEMPVQKEFLFDGHIFCINPEVNLFSNQPIIPELYKETVAKGAFTIAQLSKLVDIFLDCSKTGYMPRATFTFILQEIIWVTPENDSEWLSPELWRKLDSPGLRKVIDSLYDDLEYVYWRDFIIYNMRISYPSEKQLVVTRRALRECDPDTTELIQDYQFFSTKLWFEYEFRKEDSKKIIAIKRLLFKLYNIKNYGLNYTAMLLDFCKEESAIEGFAKALELSVGKIVCWDIEMGKIFKEEYLRANREHEEKNARRDAEISEYCEAVREELEKLVDYVVHITDELVIEDVETPKVSDSRRASILKKPSSKRNLKAEEIKFSDKVEVLRKKSQEENEQLTRQSSEEESGMTILNVEPTDSQVVRVYKELPDNVETDCSETTEIIFFLSLDVIITVITAALPWHCRVQNYDDLSFWEKAASIFEECRNPEFSMSVLSYEYLNSDTFKSLLSQTKKFTIIDPVRVLSDILTEDEYNSS